MYCIDKKRKAEQVVKQTIENNTSVIVYVVANGKNYKYGMVKITSETDTNEKGQLRYKLVRQSTDEDEENEAASHVSKHRKMSTESFYNTTLFRSRLEARWAKFFDTLGIAWSYERIKILMDDDHEYQPDFFLPQLKVFIEIKPDEPPMDARKKCEQTCKHTGMDVYLFYKDRFSIADVESGRDYTHSSAVRAMRWYNQSNTVHFDGEKHVWIVDDHEDFRIEKHVGYNLAFKHPKIVNIYDTFNDEGITNA
jgi:hypothetical protein